MSKTLYMQPIDGEEEAAKQQADVDPTKFKGKKSKAASKQGTAATQWGILAASGIPQAEIPDFRCNVLPLSIEEQALSKLHSRVSFNYFFPSYLRQPHQFFGRGFLGPLSTPVLLEIYI